VTATETAAKVWSRAEWLAKRRAGIGGSEVAAILGEHPFLGAWDVWLSKVEGYERPASPLMEQGQFIEAGVVAVVRPAAPALELVTVDAPACTRLRQTLMLHAGPLSSTTPMGAPAC
jgi:hypothetical protein